MRTPTTKRKTTTRPSRSCHLVFAQPSWRIATSTVEAFLTQIGGHLAPVTFSLAGRKVQPFSVAPWHSEKLDKSTPSIIKVLRGDFFCMPFGGNASAFGAEKHPVHGEPANGKWRLESLEKNRDGATLRCSLQTRVRSGRVDKTIHLRPAQHAIYQQHVISGMAGPMCLGHHAMLKFPDSGGLVSTSRFTVGKVFPEPIERAENHGYSMLKPGAEFDSLHAVPTVFGDRTDVSRYPARRGYEDLLILCADASQPIAWSAVVFPAERYVWFSLRDPKQLASTILWISNGGRHYAPWSGRHVNVMGIEDVTAYFHPGLKESVNDNDLARRGIKTSVQLDPGRPTALNYIMAVADVPAGFDRVADIIPRDRAVTLVSANGTSMDVAVDVGWLSRVPGIRGDTPRRVAADSGRPKRKGNR